MFLMHNLKLVQPLVGDKHHLLFIFSSHLDMSVPGLKVECGKPLHARQYIMHISDVWQ